MENINAFQNQNDGEMKHEIKSEPQSTSPFEQNKAEEMVNHNQPNGIIQNGLPGPDEDKGYG